MEQHKPSIQLSDHIKNKLRQHQPTPLSLSSDELTLSDNSDNDDVFLASATPDRPLGRRSRTFITTFELRPPSKSQSLHSLKQAEPKPNRSFAPPQPTCHECRRRENLLRSEHERLLHVYNENRKLTEQLRSAAIANRHYQEETAKLKFHLSKVNAHLKEYQLNFDLLKQQLTTERTNRSKPNAPANELQRLRRELHVYNEVVAAKKQGEQGEIDYYSSRRWADRN